MRGDEQGGHGGLRAVLLRPLPRAAALLGVVLVSLLLSNLWVLQRARPYVVDEAAAPRRPVVVVPGAAVRAGRPSAVLARRLDVAARLLHAGRADEVLVSGRADRRAGDEPAAMAAYLIELGVDDERILRDPEGVRTYETFRRAKQRYGIDAALVVTNAFHLHRSVFLARRLGIDAIGVATDDTAFRLRARLKWNAREAVARLRALYDVGP